VDAALLFPVALVVAALFVWSVHTVGRWLAQPLGLEVSDQQAAYLAIGLSAYAVAGILLGAAGLYRWPLLVALAVAPGLTALVRGAAVHRGRAGKLRTALSTLDLGPAWIAAGATAAIYLAAAAAPSFHYDLLVNYLGVPKDYLIQGSIAGLPHNIHSSLSLMLHVLIGYPLALSQLVNRTDFLFGTAAVWGALHLIAIAACGHRLVRLASALTTEGRSARWAGWVALLLWLAMPQTLLLALLENAEFVTTYLAITVAGVTLAATRRDDSLVVGALCGLMVASKPQTAAFAAAAVMIAVLRSRPMARAPAAVAAAVVLPLVAAIRNRIVYGGLLFPYRSGPGVDGDAARALMSENAVSLPAGAGELASRAWEVATLQPESGITLIAAALVLLGRVRRPGLWVLAAIALLTPVITSANTHNSLRWIQPGLLLVLLAALLNLAPVASRRSSVRWATTGFLVASLGLAVGFVVRTTGPFPHLLMTEQRFMATRIPTYEVRTAMMERPGRVLWIGELYGYYGAAKGPIAAPQDSAYFERYLGLRSAAAIRDRLNGDGIAWLSLCRLHRATAPSSGNWSWMTEQDVQTVGTLLSALPAEQPMAGVTVYRLTPGS
jgi:hypothetical protein